MRISTPITQLLGIEHPIILPGMSWVSTPELVAAVSNAGGLGILALGPLSPAQARDAILRTRQLTNRPFGVNCALVMPVAQEHVEIALALQVPVINFSLGKGDWFIDRCHAYGGKVIATVTTHKHALAAVASGVDALMVTGHEAAAHGGDVTSLVLIPAIRDVVAVPIIACGGFADHRGLVAALALGADAIAMGSRFATCQESPLHQHTKDTVIQKDQHDTIYSPHIDGMPARYMRTPMAIKLTLKPMSIISALFKSLVAAKQLAIPIWQVIVGIVAQPAKIMQLAYFGAAAPRLKAAIEQGDLITGIQFIGQSQGLIHDIVSAQEIMDRIITQAAQLATDMPIKYIAHTKLESNVF